MRIIVLAVCGLGFTLVAACESKKQRHEEMMLQTPLALDPTENIELSRWWNNGQQLLLLEDDGGYMVYEGPSRHSTVIEQGRWSQQNYATLWLEPYSASTSGRIRVHITKHDDELALLVPRYQTFKPVQSPPMTMEDRVIGRWLGSMGELRVMSGRRYELVPAAKAGAPEGAMPPVIQRGAWSVSGDELALQPGTASASPMSLKIVVQDEHVLLSAPGPGGVLTKVK